MSDTYKESSIVVEGVQPVTNDQLKLPTWGVLTILVLALVVIKSFIYIKDKKRHGK